MSYGGEREAARLRATLPCSRCHDTGAILDSADLNMGMADIAAGRTHKWSDVRRDL